MKNQEAKLFFQVDSTHGESPVYDEQTQQLYWVDISQGKVHRLGLNNLAHQSFDIGQTVGALALCPGNRFMLAIAKGFAYYDPDSRQLEVIQEVEKDLPDNRFNDAKVGPDGRFWGGTLGNEKDPTGSLYSLDGYYQVQKHEESLIVANGLDWSPDQRIFFFIDSPRKVVYAYDFDAQSGTIANRRVFIDSTNEDGVPDGMCIDREGGLWIARWDGWRVSRYDPEGKKVADIRVPVQYPTSCCFGGAKLDQLFITSSQRDVAPQSRHEQAMAGSLFYLDTDSQGFSARRFGVSA